MGALHNELRRGQLSAALTRALGAQKGAVGIERFGETLTPVIDLWSRPEWDYLRAEHRYHASIFATAGAATLSLCQLKNPAGGRTLIVVESIIITNSTAVGTYYSISLTTQLAGGARGSIFDSRHNPGLGVGTGANSVGLVISTNDYVGGGVGAAVRPIRYGLAVNASAMLALPFVVAPGEAVSVYQSTVNLTIDVSFIWRERDALPGELD